MYTSVFSPKHPHPNLENIFRKTYPQHHEIRINSGKFTPPPKRNSLGLLLSIQCRRVYKGAQGACHSYTPWIFKYVRVLRHNPWNGVMEWLHGSAPWISLQYWSLNIKAVRTRMSMAIESFEDGVGLSTRRYNNEEICESWIESATYTRYCQPQL